jgi:hypothetical protein
MRTNSKIPRTVLRETENNAKLESEQDTTLFRSRFIVFTKLHVEDVTRDGNSYS